MDELELRDLTKEKYWNIMQDISDLEPLLEIYIDDLLPQEMKWLQDHPSEGRLSDQTCETLIMLVGYSIEPLLQSIWAYQPSQIVLLLNEKYGDECGYDFGGKIERLIQKLYQIHFPEKIVPTVDARELTAVPLTVFEKLHNIVENPDGVVVDITGGKKKMVAEAFLYAAYAKIDISYVDFDDDAYDPIYRRPYGYLCRIGRLHNPYQAFALRDWEHVRELYHNYNFRAAKQALKKLTKNLRKAGFETYQQKMQDAVEKLTALLDCYAEWDSGHFNEAKVLAEKMRSWNTNFPDSITVLGGKWIEIITGTVEFKNLATYIYDDSEELKAYLYDEFSRIERLFRINEDYRSVVLRTGGLNEIIMIARLVRLVNNSGDKQALLQALVHKNPDASRVYKALLQSDGSIITIGNTRQYDISFKNAPVLSVPLTKTMQRWWQTTHYFTDDVNRQGWNKFLKLRNKMTHAYFTVPREVAGDALRFVRANFEDFLGIPISSLSLCAETLSWAELCQKCGLDQFLPLNLRQNL